MAQPQSTHGANTKPFTVIYKLKPAQAGVAARSANQGQLQQALQQIGAQKVHQKFPHASTSSHARRASSPPDITRIYQATYNSDLSFEQVKRALMATGNVAYVEPLYLREPFQGVSDPFADSTKSTAYYLKLIKAYGAWDVTHGDTNVVIGVADTGFRIDHLDLKNNIKYNHADPIDGIDNDGDGYIDNYAGWDFADNDNNVEDDTRYKNHGTGVAGVAGATTNNGVGIAGIGFKTKIMPLKVFSSVDGSFGDGYGAIVYAAQKGCKVINLSWGGEGYSQYEQDVINHVVLEHDVVVVSAAGNVRKQANYYPASYANVLSVAGSDKSDVKYKDYTWSPHVDLHAPSIDVYTTINGANSYGAGWGSSYASPMVAGAAALVRAQYPELNALQVMERIRVTTDNTTNLPGNLPYYGMLGTGRLNIKRALKQSDLKAVRCTAFSLQPKQSTQAGNIVTIEAAFRNILDPVNDLEVTLSATSPHVTVLNPSLKLGSMATMASTDNRNAPFQIAISPEAPLNAIVAFRLDYTDGNYTDYQYFEMDVNRDYHTLTANNLHLTVNSRGNIGYDGLDLSRGVGATYKGSNSLLFEGGLMIGISPERVSDDLRNDNWLNDGDFTPVQTARTYYNTPLAAQEIRGLMQDIYPSTGTVGVAVKYRTLAWNSAPDQDYVIQEFTIRNLTP
ncbi:MAG TPA: S8 family serine peptidase, partial [Pontibacter sp.]